MEEMINNVKRVIEEMRINAPHMIDERKYDGWLKKAVDTLDKMRSV